MTVRQRLLTDNPIGERSGAAQMMGRLGPIVTMITLLIAVFHGDILKAQDTVVVGGSGLPGVEVDLATLDGVPSPNGAQRLLMPGEEWDDRYTEWLQPVEINSFEYAATTAPSTESGVEEAPPAEPVGEKLLMTAPEVEANIIATSEFKEPQALLTKSITETTGPSQMESSQAPAAIDKVEISTLKTSDPVIVTTTTTQSAKLTSPNNIALQVLFETGNARLTAEWQEMLQTIARSAIQSDIHMQLKAYAGTEGEPISAARRLSLSRALAVRAFLIEQDVKSTRIDVRALGIVADSGPPERVDVIYLGR